MNRRKIQYLYRNHSILDTRDLACAPQYGTILMLDVNIGRVPSFRPLPSTSMRVTPVSPVVVALLDGLGGTVHIYIGGARPEFTGNKVGANLRRLYFAYPAVLLPQESLLVSRI